MYKIVEAEELPPCFDEATLRRLLDVVFQVKVEIRKGIVVRVPEPIREHILIVSGTLG
jgi:hypothetical protein